MLRDREMPAPLTFRKYEGLGNDFIIVEPRDLAVTPALASALCDRHFGIGGDGILVVLPPRVSDADARMVVVNSDGSCPEMCGNGVRCVAVHLARARDLRTGVIRVETAAGIRACIVEDGLGEGMVTVDMGTVRVGEDRDVEVDGERLPVTLADVGNPHAVAFGSFSRQDVERLGSRITVHATFPAGINVEFARMRMDGIDLVVWERGAGITLACGTGACAAAAVACAKGHASYEAPIDVRLPGGSLCVQVQRDGRTTMRGPARHVFSGTIDVGESGPRVSSS
jgi:diaminopimelate epimerase